MWHREITVTIRLIDATAAMVAAITVALAAFAATTTTPVTPWCAVTGSLAGTLGVMAYLARHVDDIENKAYREGFQNGLDARTVLKLADTPSGR